MQRDLGSWVEGSSVCICVRERVSQLLEKLAAGRDGERGRGENSKNINNALSACPVVNSVFFFLNMS